MIYFFVPSASRFGIDDYVADRGGPLADVLSVVPYEDLVRERTVPTGTCVLSALDQLTGPQRAAAVELCESLPPTARVLNHPGRTLLRYDLLRKLHVRGVNDFRAFRLSDKIDSLRFPVFLREENAHRGNVSELVTTRKELDAALVVAIIRGVPASELLVVEFSDTVSSNGVYRKYSAYVVGDAVIPRCINSCDYWMVKHSRIAYDDASIREEREYLESNPHESWLRDEFRQANVQYGRIDYSLRDGEPRIWEINTHPTIGGRRDNRKIRPPAQEEIYRKREPTRKMFFDRFMEAWRAVDSKSASGAVTPSKTANDAGSESGARERGRTLAEWSRAPLASPSARRVVKKLLMRPLVGLSPWIAPLVLTWMRRR